jgi:hypothetical protein
MGEILQQAGKSPHAKNPPLPFSTYNYLPPPPPTHTPPVTPYYGTQIMMQTGDRNYRKESWKHRKYEKANKGLISRGSSHPKDPHALEHLNENIRDPGRQL